MPFKKEDKFNEKPVLSSTRNKVAAKVQNKIKKQTKSKPLRKHIVQNKQQKAKVLHAPLREINNVDAESSKATIKAVLPTTVPHNSVPDKSTTEVDQNKKKTPSASTTTSLVLSHTRTEIVTVAKSNILAAPIMATGKLAVNGSIVLSVIVEKIFTLLRKNFKM